MSEQCPVCESGPADKESEDDRYPYLCPNDDCTVYNYRGA